MPYEDLKERVCRLNLALVDAGLVVLTWGNASGVDRKAGVMAIKPSGLVYAAMKPEHVIVMSLETGKIVDGPGRPSSDTPTHLHLYREFPAIGAVVHTHSTYATSFAQAQRDLPCFGTTHADNFHGAIPCTRAMTREEIENDYELNTGKVIVECFRQRGLDPLDVPGVLVSSHAPFTWGVNEDKALENAIVMEFAALMALHSLALNPKLGQIPEILLDRHFKRKHGPTAYYGQ